MADLDDLDRLEAEADAAMPLSTPIDIDLTTAAQAEYNRDRDARHGLLVDDPRGVPRPVGVYDLGPFERPMTPEERADNDRRKSFLQNAAVIESALDETDEEIEERARRVEAEHRAAIAAQRGDVSQTPDMPKATARRIWRSLGGAPANLRPSLRDRVRGTLRR